jgi:hypothetical protein
MYAEGQGVRQDNFYAHMWWNIAARLVSPRRSNATSAFTSSDECGGVPEWSNRTVSKTVSSGSKHAVESRDIVAKRMTPSQLAEAQNLACECVKKNYKGC